MYDSIFFSYAYCTSPRLRGFYSPKRDFSTALHGTTFPQSPNSGGSSNFYNSSKTNQERSKMIALSLGPVTISNRITEVVELLLSHHIAFLEKFVLLNKNKVNARGDIGIHQALDFLKSAPGRLFFISLVGKGYSSKVGWMSRADLRLMKFARSFIQTLLSSFEGLGTLEGPAKVAQALGSITISSRILEIIGLVLDYYVVSLEKDLVNKTNDLGYTGIQLALDFLKSDAGRRFLIAYIQKRFGPKEATMVNADLRLIASAGFFIDLLPAFCVLLKTGAVPVDTNQSTTKTLSSMVKEFKAMEQNFLTEA